MELTTRWRNYWSTPRGKFFSITALLFGILIIFAYGFMGLLLVIVILAFSVFEQTMRDRSNLFVPRWVRLVGWAILILWILSKFRYLM